MSKTNHTPGPWAVNRIENDIGLIASKDPKNNGGMYVAHTLGKDRKPNAHLIAAAPELLGALLKAEAALADIGDADREPGDDVAWCEARAAQDLPFVRFAIAKARGLV